MLINGYRDCDKLCAYFHLPVQSGNNNILKENEQKIYKWKMICFVAY